jgi:hypothetical protein
MSTYFAICGIVNLALVVVSPFPLFNAVAALVCFVLGAPLPSVRRAGLVVLIPVRLAVLALLSPFCLAIVLCYPGRVRGLTVVAAAAGRDVARIVACR